MTRSSSGASACRSWFATWTRRRARWTPKSATSSSSGSPRRACGAGSPVRPRRSSTRTSPPLKARMAGSTSCWSSSASGMAGLRVEAGHFTGWSLGARFYPVLYMLTRMGEARDWGTGLPLKASLLGKMSRLEVHHIFPKAQLYKLKHKRPDVNALAQFLLPDQGHEPQHQRPPAGGLFPGDRGEAPGGAGFPVDSDRPGALEDRSLPRFSRSPEGAARRRGEPALRGTASWRHALDGHGGSGGTKPNRRRVGGITSEVEEAELESLNDWVEARACRAARSASTTPIRPPARRRPCSISPGPTGFRRA